MTSTLHPMPGVPRDTTRRIGLLGGSFNPAHEGHRHISLEALKRLGLRLEVEDQGVMRAVVSDGAPAFVYSRKSATVGADHLGLFLVETLADRWGLSFGGRKAVWFEVDPTA